VDNRFTCGGENVQPEEVERALCGLPGVVEALVAPMPDDDLGAVPVAFVSLDSRAAPDAAALQGALAAELPRYAIPRHVFPWTEVPDSADKVNRRRLGSRAAELLHDESG
jgi:O-succinylbenzoic acid--CoA ligase